ncbi:MAG: sensor histidine kinase [Candidatus Cryptobacteroides sp.]
MKKIHLLIDLVFCLVLLPLMIVFFPVERWWGSYPVFFGIFIAWLYVTYFLFRYFIIPRLFKKGRPRRIALVTIALTFAVTFLLSCYDIRSPYYHMNREQYAQDGHFVWGVRQNKQAVWLHFTIVVFFCFSVGMLDEAYRQTLAREEIEYQRDKAELALYKAQINPHFLFNTLNTLYGLLIASSDKTEAAFERFIEITKYLYVNASRDWIPLEEDVGYIEKYIDLQKLRLGDTAEVQFTHTLQEPGMSIPPMLLITFVENAFKYGISSNERCFIHIRLVQDAGGLLFEVVNSLFERSGKASGSAGSGIENCRKRLSLIYPGRHSLNCGPDGEGHYRAELRILS